MEYKGYSSKHKYHLAKKKELEEKERLDAKICLNCTKPYCDGSCELIGRKKEDRERRAKKFYKLLKNS